MQKLITEQQVSTEAIIAAGITNQRETTVLWDRKTGEPLYNAIVWQDRRTAEFCQNLKQQVGLEQQIRKKTGLRSEEHTSELQSRPHLVCRLLLEKKKKKKTK